MRSGEPRLTWHDVSSIAFWADRVGKPDVDDHPGGVVTRLIGAIGSARHRLLLQTPYLVFTDATIEFFGMLHDEVEITVHTNSLASTDNWTSYAHSIRQRFEMSWSASGTSTAARFLFSPRTQLMCVEQPPVRADNADVELEWKVAFAVEHVFELDALEALLRRLGDHLIRGVEKANRNRAVVQEVDIDEPAQEYLVAFAAGLQGFHIISRPQAMKRPRIEELGVASVPVENRFVERGPKALLVTSGVAGRIPDLLALFRFARPHPVC